MGFFDIFKKKKKMSDGLEKTGTDFFQNIVDTLTSSVIDDDLYNDLEEQLILADVGPSCAVRLVDELRDEVEINGLHTGQEALDALRDIIRREVSPKTDLDLSGKPAVYSGCGRERRGQNHHHCQAGLSAQGSGQAGHAGGRRYLPRSGQRTAGNLSRPCRGAAGQGGRGR